MVMPARGWTFLRVPQDLRTQDGAMRPRAVRLVWVGDSSLVLGAVLLLLCRLRGTTSMSTSSREVLGVVEEGVGVITTDSLMVGIGTEGTVEGMEVEEVITVVDVIVGVGIMETKIKIMAEETVGMVGEEGEGIVVEVVEEGEEAGGDSDERPLEDDRKRPMYVTTSAICVLTLLGLRILCSPSLAPCLFGRYSF